MAYAGMAKTSESEDREGRFPLCKCCSLCLCKRFVSDVLMRKNTMSFKKCKKLTLYPRKDLNNRHFVLETLFKRSVLRIHEILVRIRAGSGFATLEKIILLVF